MFGIHASRFAPDFSVASPASCIFIPSNLAGWDESALESGEIAVVVVGIVEDPVDGKSFQCFLQYFSRENMHPALQEIQPTYGPGASVVWKRCHECQMGVLDGPTFAPC